MMTAMLQDLAQELADVCADIRDTPSGTSTQHTAGWADSSGSRTPTGLPSGPTDSLGAGALLPGGVAPASISAFRAVDFAAKGYHLAAAVEPNQVVAAAQCLDRRGFSLDTITGMDWLAEAEMEIVYDYFHPENGRRVVIRTRVPRGCPQLPTISEVFSGADWHERETHEFFGIRFLGHPDLSPLLLPEDADYHPLLKDFAP